MHSINPFREVSKSRVMGDIMRELFWKCAMAIYLIAVIISITVIIPIHSVFHCIIAFGSALKACAYGTKDALTSAYKEVLTAYENPTKSKEIG